MKTEVRSALLASSVVGESVDATYRFAPDLAVFAGHFPGHPLVPGVYLVEAARHLGECVLGRPARIARVDDARFVRPIAPGESVAARLTISRASASSAVHASNATRTPDAAQATDAQGASDTERPSDAAWACDARFSVDGVEAARVRLVLADTGGAS